MKGNKNPRLNKQVLDVMDVNRWKEYRAKPAVGRKTAKVKRELDKKQK